jgi:hypothetical protein
MSLRSENDDPNRAYEEQRLPLYIGEYGPKNPVDCFLYSDVVVAYGVLEEQPLRSESSEMQ